MPRKITFHLGKPKANRSSPSAPKSDQIVVSQQGYSPARAITISSVESDQSIDSIEPVDHKHPPIRIKPSAKKHKTSHTSELGVDRRVASRPPPHLKLLTKKRRSRPRRSSSPPQFSPPLPPQPKLTKFQISSRTFARRRATTNIALILRNYVPDFDTHIRIEEGEWVTDVERITGWTSRGTNKQGERGEFPGRFVGKVEEVSKKGDAERRGRDASPGKPVGREQHRNRSQPDVDMGGGDDGDGGLILAENDDQPINPQNMDVDDDEGADQLMREMAARNVAPEATEEALKEKTGGIATRLVRNYEAEDDNQITLVCGEPVTNVVLLKRGDVCEDTNFSGTRGIFPTISVTSAIPSIQTTHDIRSRQAPSSFVSAQSNDPKASHKEPRFTPKHRIFKKDRQGPNHEARMESNRHQAIVLYSHNKKAETELGPVEGEMTTHIGFAMSNWWAGTNPRGDGGRFPPGRVQLIRESEEEQDVIELSSDGEQEWEWEDEMSDDEESEGERMNVAEAVNVPKPEATAIDNNGSHDDSLLGSALGESMELGTQPRRPEASIVIVDSETPLEDALEHTPPVRPVRGPLFRGPAEPAITASVSSQNPSTEHTANSSASAGTSPPATDIGNDSAAEEPDSKPKVKMLSKRQAKKKAKKLRKELKHRPVYEEHEEVLLGTVELSHLRDVVNEHAAIRRAIHKATTNIPNRAAEKEAELEQKLMKVRKMWVPYANKDYSEFSILSPEEKIRLETEERQMVEKHARIMEEKGKPLRNVVTELEYNWHKNIGGPKYKFSGNAFREVQRDPYDTETQAIKLGSNGVKAWESVKEKEARSADREEHSKEAEYQKVLKGWTTRELMWLRAHVKSVEQKSDKQLAQEYCEHFRGHDRLATVKEIIYATKNLIVLPQYQPEKLWEDAPGKIGYLLGLHALQLDKGKPTHGIPDSYEKCYKWMIEKYPFHQYPTTPGLDQRINIDAALYCYHENNALLGHTNIIRTYPTRHSSPFIPLILNLYSARKTPREIHAATNGEVSFDTIIFILVRFSKNFYKSWTPPDLGAPDSYFTTLKSEGEKVLEFVRKSAGFPRKYGGAPELLRDDPDEESGLAEEGEDPDVWRWDGEKDEEAIASARERKESRDERRKRMRREAYYRRKEARKTALELKDGCVDGKGS